MTPTGFEHMTLREFLADTEAFVAKLRADALDREFRAPIPNAECERRAGGLTLHGVTR